MAIGDLTEGGIVFYEDIRTYIAAIEDIKIPLYWGKVGVPVSGTSVAFETGENNTANIVDLCTGNTMIAANVCLNYSNDGYDDWFLPSAGELNELYLVKDIIGGFDEYTNYWTSSQNTPETAWIQNFGTGIQSRLGGKDQLYKVRPIRVVAPI